MSKHNRHPQPHPRQPQPKGGKGPTIFAEVIITRKIPRDATEDEVEKSVVAFRRAAYQLQHGGPSPVFVVLEETSGDIHLFHWDDVDRVKAIPTQLTLADVN